MRVGPLERMGFAVPGTDYFSEWHLPWIFGRTPPRQVGLKGHTMVRYAAWTQHLITQLQ